MPKPLYDAIKKYSNNAVARFCMPGHSGQRGEDGIYSAAVFDWTEVDGLDNLLYSEGVIADSEKSIAEKYGYSYALMLTNGCTCAMQIAMAFAKQRGGVALAYGGMHKSFYSAARIMNVEIRECCDLTEAKKIAEQNDVGCIFVTTPDYFGKLTALGDVKQFAERIGAALIVDEAHSAHFPYSKLLPDNASAYADLAFASMHKTLPVYGGGAILFVNEKSNYEICRRLRADIHSTSPNYLVMASMDYANDWFSARGEQEYAKVKSAIEQFATLNKIGEIVSNDDFTRLVLKIQGADCNLASLQLAERGIYAEMAYQDKLVFIVTPLNCDKLALLAGALKDIRYERTTEEIQQGDMRMERSNKSGKIVYVKIEDCLGKVSARDIGIYPPGVPAIKKGDVINQNALNFLKKYSSRLFGLASGKVAVIE